LVGQVVHIADATIDQLVKINGVGEVKAVQLKSAADNFHVKCAEMEFNNLESSRLGFPPEEWRTMAYETKLECINSYLNSLVEDRKGALFPYPPQIKSESIKDMMEVDAVECEDEAGAVSSGARGRGDARRAGTNGHNPRGAAPAGGGRPQRLGRARPEGGSGNVDTGPWTMVCTAQTNKRGDEGHASVNVWDDPTRDDGTAVRDEELALEVGTRGEKAKKAKLGHEETGQRAMGRGATRTSRASRTSGAVTPHDEGEQVMKEKDGHDGMEGETKIVEDETGEWSDEDDAGFQMALALSMTSGDGGASGPDHYASRTTTEQVFKRLHAFSTTTRELDMNAREMYNIDDERRVLSGNKVGHGNKTQQVAELELVRNDLEHLSNVVSPTSMSETKIHEFLTEPRFKLLQWIVGSNRTCLVHLPSSLCMPVEASRQFAMCSAASFSEKQTFEYLKRQGGSTFAWYHARPWEWHGKLTVSFVAFYLFFCLFCYWCGHCLLRSTTDFWRMWTIW